MNSIRLVLAVVAAMLVGNPSGFAQDDNAQIFNAFSVAVANGTIVRSAEKQLMLAGTLAGPMFVETDEGPVAAGKVTCAASVHLDLTNAHQDGSGACTFVGETGDTAWGDWQCAGYELVGCRGTFKLHGGTGRMAGASGEGTMIWRPSARELKSQLDGTALLNVNGIVIWRDFKISKSN